MSQNRLSELEEKPEELTLQVKLLTEQEVTRLISLVNSIAEKLEVPIDEPDLGELMPEESPEKFLNVIEKEMSKLES